MKNNVRKALETVNTVNDIASRLAAAEVTVQTTNCAVQGDNSEFLRAVNAAETALRTAFDDVMAQELTALDNALDRVRRARQAYYRNVATNRKDAASLTAEAKMFADKCKQS